MLPVCYIHLYAEAVLTSLLLFPVQFVSANQVSRRFTSMKLLYRKQAQPPESSFSFSYFLFFKCSQWVAAEAAFTWILTDPSARLQTTKCAISKQVLINCTAVVEMRYPHGAGESWLFCGTAVALPHSDSVVRAAYAGWLLRNRGCCSPLCAPPSATGVLAPRGAATHTGFAPVLNLIL